MAAWTPEQKAKVSELYAEGNPTPENSTELIKEIAEKIGQTANGVRMVLVQAGEYVKKEAATSTTAKGKTEGKTRVSKESQIEALAAAITAKGATPDMEILEKLTGKAAAYFTEVLTA